MGWLVIWAGHDSGIGCESRDGFDGEDSIILDKESLRTREKNPHRGLHSAGGRPEGEA